MTKKILNYGISVLATFLLAGCGGIDQIDLSCDKPAPYQAAVETDRVVAPEGLDQLDLSQEMPVPSASPQPARTPGEPCLDIPPRYIDGLRISGGSEEDEDDS